MDQSPKVVRPIKVVRLTSEVPQPVLLVHRQRDVPVVLLAEGNMAILIHRPPCVPVPLLPSRSAVGQERAAVLLRHAAQWPAEVYLVAVRHAAGVVGYGMVAVPVGKVPTFRAATKPSLRRTSA